MRIGVSKKKISNELPCTCSYEECDNKIDRSKNPRSKFCSKNCREKQRTLDRKANGLPSYYERNRDARLSYQNNYYKDPENLKRNREGVRERRKRPDSKRKRADYEAKRYKENPNYKIKRVIGSRIRDGLVSIGKGGHKTEYGLRTEGILGASLEEVVKWIESQWEEGMSWDNYGRDGLWEIDHWVPQAFAKDDCPEDIYALNHYTNLRPMFWFDNNVKSDVLHLEDLRYDLKIRFASIISQEMSRTQGKRLNRVKA